MDFSNNFVCKGTAYSSYRYWPDKGETAFLEQFVRYDKLYPWSKNHHLLGDIVNWFMSVIGELKVQSCDYVMINPQFIKDINHCKTTHKLPNGDVKIYRERLADKIELTVNCSNNIKFEIIKNPSLKYIEKNKNVYLIEE